MGVWTKKIIDMFFKDIKGIQVVNKNVQLRIFIYLFDLHINSRKVLRTFPLNKVLLFGVMESYYLKSYESVKFAYPYDDREGFPNSS